MKPGPAIFALLMSSGWITGCLGKWDANKAPEGFGIIREHAITAPRNLPPINSDWDFTIVDIDGKPVVRETYPAWVDIQPGAQIPAGIHHIRGRVQPHLLPPNFQPREVSFDAKVDSGKVYFVLGHENGASLVESHTAP